MSHREIVKQLVAIGEKPITGEAWTWPARVLFAAGDLPMLERIGGYAVSSAGRVLSMPRTVVQGTRGGGTCQRSVAGRVMIRLGERPTVGHSGLHLGPAILTAFDRLPRRPVEKARRHNGWRADCSLENLIWEDDLMDGAMVGFARLAAEVGPTLARAALGHSGTIAQRWLAWAVSQGVRPSKDWTDAPRFWRDAQVAAEERVSENAARRARRVEEVLGT